MSWVPGKLWILVKPGMGSSSTNESLAVSGGYVLTIFFCGPSKIGNGYWFDVSNFHGLRWVKINASSPCTSRCTRPVASSIQKVFFSRQQTF